MDSDPTQTVFVACQLNYDSLSFRFEGIVWSDFHDGSVGIPAFVREGQNVHIKATVDKYNPDSGFPVYRWVPCFSEGSGLSEKHGTHFSISRDFWPTCGIPVWKCAEPCNIACGHGGHYG
ncbi:DUF4839 domain-containing protein [Bifidobacterium adolescentis]